MASEDSVNTTTGKPANPLADILRPISLVAAIVGAAGSICLMVAASQKPPVLLLILFLIWVPAPFIVLILANMIGKRWPALVRMTLYGVTLTLSVVSLIVYL